MLPFQELTVQDWLAVNVFFVLILVQLSMAGLEPHNHYFRYSFLCFSINFLRFKLLILNALISPSKLLPTLNLRFEHFITLVLILTSSQYKRLNIKYSMPSIDSPIKCLNKSNSFVSMFNHRCLWERLTHILCTEIFNKVIEMWANGISYMHTRMNAEKKRPTRQLSIFRILCYVRDAYPRNFFFSVISCVWYKSVNGLCNGFLGNISIFWEWIHRFNTLLICFSLVNKQRHLQTMFIQYH